MSKPGDEDFLCKIIDILIEEKLANPQFQKPKKTAGDYEEREIELISLSDDIKDIMGSDEKVFMRYEELSTLNENISIKEAYKEGFVNAIKLLKGIASIGH